MKKLVTVLLVFVSAALVQQSFAQGAAQPAQGAPATQQKQIKDPAEYNAYVNAIQQSDPAQKSQALEAFLQTYPNSVMKEDALEQLMVAYQQAGNGQKTIDAANRVLQAESQQRARPGPAGLQLSRDGRRRVVRRCSTTSPRQSSMARGTAGVAQACPSRTA